MTAFLRDLRYGARSLGRAPLLTGALVVTVAIGIGGYAAVAAFINGLFAGTVGVPDLRGIVTVEWHAGAERSLPVPYPAFSKLRSGTPAFASLAAYRESRVNVAIEGHNGWMTAILATPDLWNVLRVPSMLGRMTFEPRRPDGAIGAVLANRTWQNEFAANTQVVGTDLVVNGLHARVTAVAPASFDGLYLGRPIDLWLPLDPLSHDAGIRAVGVIGRLAPKISLRATQQAVTSSTGAEPGASVFPYSGVEPDARLRLARLQRVLAIAALLMLLTAAANVAGFLLSRAGRRSHETAARVALGATRGRLASQIVAESLLVSLGGGALAVFAAYWTASVMPALLYIEDAEHLVLAPHVGPIIATVATYSVIMVVCALAPLSELHRHGTMAAMGRSGVTSVGWLRSTLVIAQTSACVVLVVGAALLLQEFQGSLRSVQAAHIGQPVVATIEAAVQYSNETSGRALFARAEQEVARISGVGSVAWIATLPGGRAFDSAMQIDQPPLGWQSVAIGTAAPPGRDLVALPLKAGRMFGGGDSPTSCRVALVNDAAAAKHFPAGAVGRSFKDASGRRVDIVGVVAAPTDDPDPRVYFYERQVGEGARAIQHETLQFPIWPASSGSVADLDVNLASPGYFDTVGATFQQGGDFAAGRACGVAVVNREAAQRDFGGHALGGAVIDGDGQRAEIVGVVDEESLQLMQRGSNPMVYFPMSQRYAPRMTLVAQTSVATPALLNAMRTRLLALPGLFGPPGVETLDSRLVRTALGPERVSAVAVTTSAALALALSLLGVYGMMSDAVLQRKREIAIRLALGAQSWRIVAGVVRDGARIAAAGAATGVAAAWILVAVARHLEPGTVALPLWIWTAGPIVLTVVVALASVFPARWALAVDPLTLTREG